MVSGLLTHGSGQKYFDRPNNDTFRDMHYSVWLRRSIAGNIQSDRMMAQFGIKACMKTRTGGQNAADFVNKPYYEFGNRTKSARHFAKIATLFPKNLTGIKALS